MTLKSFKSDATFEEKLTLGSKNDTFRVSFLEPRVTFSSNFGEF